MNTSDNRFEISVAPMLGWTNTHARYFYRLLSKSVMLYTEMLTAPALINGPRESLLNFSNAESPLTVQLAGSKPDDLAQCAKLVTEKGCDEININVGCPSKRAQSGNFGACLITNPALIADCVAAMISAVDVPISVKTRIGVSGTDEYKNIAGFVEKVSATGCKKFIIHARSAKLAGFSPKDNRSKLPLQYEMVYRLKQDFPQLSIILNGGLASIEMIESQIGRVDGVMLGRAICVNPYLLAEAEQRFFASTEIPTRGQIIEAYLPYLREQQAKGLSWQILTRHLQGLYYSTPGARKWRVALSRGELISL